MIILVDFENTHVNGMEGYTYLNETDTVVVYYSDENSAVTRGMVEDLKNRQVNVRMVKLLKQHANALDMYIASTTGMFLDTGEKICIVSKDKGYAAVRDFWHSLRGAEILLGETIEECFLHSVANDDPRIRSVKERSQKALLTESFETMNRIPTRPTLSRANSRRRRSDELDTTKNLEPVTILPNPLVKQAPKEEAVLPAAEEHAELVDGLQMEEALPVSVENVGDDRPVNRGGYTNLRPEQSRKSNSRRPGRDGRNGQRRNDRRIAGEAVFYGEENMPVNTEEPVKPMAGTAAKADEKAAEMREQEVAAEAEKKTTILNEKKETERVLPRINKNQISYVYDPLTGTMKKLEPVMAEEKPEDTIIAEADVKAETETAVQPETDAAKVVNEVEAAEPESAEESAAAVTADISLEELMEKYGKSCNTTHQYYVKLVKTFGKPVGRDLFNSTKKEMQAYLKLKKQKAAESDEVLVFAETESAGNVSPEDVAAIENAEPTEASMEGVSTFEEEHPMIDALPVFTAETVDSDPETASAEAAEEKTDGVEGAPVKVTFVAFDEAEQNALREESENYVQLSMNFPEEETSTDETVTAETFVKTEEETTAADAAEILEAPENTAVTGAAEETADNTDMPVKKSAKRKRTRKAKTEPAENAEVESGEEKAAFDEAEVKAEDAPAEDAPVKKKTTRRKTSSKKTKAEAAETDAEAAAAETAADVTAAETAAEAKKKPTRRRARKVKPETAPEAGEESKENN